MDTDAIDLKYAREAAEFIGADHTEVYICLLYTSRCV